MIIGITLAETDERDHPTVASAVLRPRGLASDKVVERVDGEHRVEHQHGAEDSGKGEAIDRAGISRVHLTGHARKEGPRGHDQPVVPVLPGDQGIGARFRGKTIFTLGGLH